MKITKPKRMALTVTLLKQRGAPKKHALVQADVLWGAEMRGRPSHGLQRLSRILALDIHGTLDAKFPCNKGHLLIAIDASSSRGVGDRLLQYLDQIRSSEPADPETPIRVPGDGAASRASTASRGGFSVDSRLWRELNCLLRPLVPARVGSGQ
jgi:LDH2 family malate/lactate/ureidoglycolate dehydrogenase